MMLPPGPLLQEYEIGNSSRTQSLQGGGGGGGGGGGFEERGPATAPYLPTMQYRQTVLFASNNYVLVDVFEPY